MSVDCLKRRRYAALVGLGRPLCLGTKVKRQRHWLHYPGFDNPTIAVQEHGTYGGQRKAVGCVPPTALLFGTQYKIIKIKFVASMIAVTPATASSKASLASW